MNRSGTTSPIVPSRTIAQELITYSVKISDDFHEEEFYFSHCLPPALQKDVNPVSNRPALVAFMDQVVHEHHRELLAAYPWKCLRCGLPATTLVHHPVPILHLDEDKQIRNDPTPVCFDGSRCWKFALSCVHETMIALSDIFEGGSISTLMPERTSLKRCGYCAKADVIDGDTLKKCGTCKVVRYCSSECQAADWPNHKKVCKHIAARNNK